MMWKQCFMVSLKNEQINHKKYHSPYFEVFCRNLLNPTTWLVSCQQYVDNGVIEITPIVNKTLYSIVRSEEKVIPTWKIVKS